MKNTYFHQLRVDPFREGFLLDILPLVCNQQKESVSGPFVKTIDGSGVLRP